MLLLDGLFNYSSTFLFQLPTETNIPNYFALNASALGLKLYANNAINKGCFN